MHYDKDADALYVRFADGKVEESEEVSPGVVIDFDDAGAIGRRYRREDEIGTPLCITVDFDTLDDQAVTIRERDTMQQERVALDKVADYVAARIGEKHVRYPQVPVEMGGEAWPESVKIAEAGGLY